MTDAEYQSATDVARDAAVYARDAGLDRARAQESQVLAAALGRPHTDRYYRARDVSALLSERLAQGDYDYVDALYRRVFE